MKLEARVKFFRGIDDAAIHIDGVTLVCGLNGVGKSSLLQAVAAAAANCPIPFFKSEKPDSALVSKKDAKQLVHDGQDEGGVRLASDDGAVQIGWPGLERETSGDAPEISRVAAGILTPLEMERADRAAFFSHLLQTTPTLDELTAALTSKAVGLDPEQDEPAISAIVQKVELGGFDAAHGYVKENGAKLKGRWEEVTGERFGVTKTEWTPKGWTDALVDLTPEIIEEQLADARQARDDALSKAAVDQDRMTELRENAQKEQTTKALHEDAFVKLGRITQTVKECQEQLEKATPPKLVPCAHCGGMNKVTAQPDGALLVEQSDINEEEYKKLEAAYAQAKAELRDATALKVEADHADISAASQYARYKGAQAMLAAAEERTGDAPANAAALERVAKLEATLAMIEAKAKADGYHGRILLHNKILEVLAPTGLRQKKLTEAIAGFNTLLSGTCEGAQFAPVVLAEDLSVAYDGRANFLCSDSQKWRCRVAVQIATAVKEEAPLVIIDGADILDADSREGLFEALLAFAKPVADGGLGMNALVAMTLPKKEHVPPLGKLKLGHSYWLSDGRIETSM